MRSIALVARTVTEKQNSDVRINFGKVLLLTIPTLGIYNAIVYFRLIKRLKLHYKRQHMLYRDILSFLIEYSSSKSCDIDGIIQLKNEISEAQYEEDTLNPWFWFIISILTLGIGSIYPLYRLTVDPYRHDKLENRIIGRLNSILIGQGIIDKPIEKCFQCKKRIFLLYLIFTILTLGVFSIYWSYVVISDFNKHFNEHEEWEINLLNNLSNF